MMPSVDETGLRVSTPSEREIRIEREFAAPPHLVYDAWTKPELIRRWLTGPDGWVFVTCEVDLRVGGGFRFVWRGPDGTEMGMRGVYRDLTPPDRIVHAERYDQDWTGGETEVTTLLEEREGRTRLTTTVRYASRETRDAALGSGMTDGIAAGYARLAGLLETLPAPEAGR